MANEDRRSISFALIGHGGDGKTTLADSLLFAAGVTSRLGRVDDGTSFMNWLPEEKLRRASISTSVCSFAHGDAEFTMLDVPGDANFGGELRGALAAVDNAVIVMNAARRREVRHRARLPLRARARARARGGRQQARPRARRLRRAREADRGGARRARREAPPAARARREVRGLREPADGQAPQARPRRQDPDRRAAGRPGRRDRGREARDDRGGRRGRRRACSRSTSRTARSPRPRSSRPCARACATTPCCRSCARRPARTSAAWRSCSRPRTSSRARPRRPRARRARARPRSSSPRTRAPTSPRWSGRRSPTATPDSSRCCASSPEPSRKT